MQEKMRNTFRRLLSIVAAIAMVIGIVGGSTVPAMADETVTNTTDHSYKAYQIFTGTQESGSAELGDVKWGDGIKVSDFLTALQADANFEVNEANIFAGIDSTSDDSAQKVAEALANNTSAYDSPLAKEFANVAAKYTQGDGTAIAAGSESTPTQTVNLSSGYYLIVDTTESPSDGAYNSALLQVTGNVNITKKYTVPEFDKNIVRNDTAAVTGKAVDRNIGDTVSYELRGTIPSNLDDYDTYKYVFHDTLSKGQKIDVSSIKVWLVSEGAQDQDITNSFENSKITGNTSEALSNDNAGTGSESLTFTVGIDNLKTIEGVSSTKQIVVRYNATLTSNAVIGQAGNKNEGYLEYSNNPNGTGEGETPHKDTYVYTYQLDVTKIDGKQNKKTLPGAQFVLKATDGIHNEKYVQIDAETGKVTGWLDSKPTEVDSRPESGNTGVLVSDNSGKVTVSGLDKGNYELEEIKAPAGYNKLTTPITITIKANIEDENVSTPNSALTSLTINNDTTNYAKDGILPLSVVNNAGSLLPSTGGIGTTVFYVLGGCLVAAAAIVLIARKKRNA